MLPFLKPKKQAGVVSVVTKPDGKQEPDNSNDGMVAVAEEMMSAISMKDAVALADAMKAMFQMMEMMPHEEIDHEG